MPHLLSYSHPRFGNANVAFTIFAIYLIISIYIFATYLQGANLCKPFFRPVFDSSKGKRLSKGVNPPYRS